MTDPTPAASDFRPPDEAEFVELIAQGLRLCSSVGAALSAAQITDLAVGAMTILSINARLHHPPRVFRHDEVVPAGVRVIDEQGRTYPQTWEDDADAEPYEWINGMGPLVEVHLDHAMEVARDTGRRKAEGGEYR